MTTGSIKLEICFYFWINGNRTGDAVVTIVPVLYNQPHVMDYRRGCKVREWITEGGCSAIRVIHSISVKIPEVRFCISDNGGILDIHIYPGTNLRVRHFKIRFLERI